MRPITSISCLVVLLIAADLTHAQDATADPQLTSRYQAILAAQATDPAVQAFAARLGLIEEVRQKLNGSFERFRSIALNELLDDAIGAPKLPTQRAVSRPATSSAGPATGSAIVTAVDLLSAYAPRLAQPLPVPPIAPAEQQMLRDYYTAAVRSAGAHIAERGRTAVAGHPKEAFHIVGLSLVLPLLHTADDAWSQADIAALPQWLRRPEMFTQLEEVSLTVLRPLTAYEFTRAAASEATQPAAADRLAYLGKTADRLLRENRPAAAVACLRTAVALTRPQGKFEDIAALHFRLAEVLSDTAQPVLAAREMAELLAAKPQSDVFGRAAMLQLKYLYEAQEFKNVLAVSPGLQRDERCQAYLPQMLYVTWVSARRADAAALAEQLRQQFLKRFPDHALAADIYFAHAMEALASSEYEEASRLLEFIEFRFPQSRLIPKVKQIQERLRGQAAPSI